MGCDPGFGSSAFAICVTELRNGKICVIEAEEYDRADFSDMISEIWNIKQRYGNLSNIYVDASAPVIWQTLKREFEEESSNEYVRERFAYAKKYNLHIEDQMLVVPVPFGGGEGAKMLQHTKWLLEERDYDGSSLLAIDRERFHKLVTALRTAVANEYKLDKTQTSYHDLLDAFRLSLQYFKRVKG